eukprot:scaffold39511_cov19-Tisochrysis_lutea.AAC.1
MRKTSVHGTWKISVHCTRKISMYGTKKISVHCTRKIRAHCISVMLRACIDAALHALCMPESTVPVCMLQTLEGKLKLQHAVRTLQRNAQKAQQSPALKAEADLLQSQRMLPQAMDLVRAAFGLKGPVVKQREEVRRPQKPSDKQQREEVRWSLWPCHKSTEELRQPQRP